MEHKYKSKIMNQKFFKGTSLIKLVLFLFLGICSININAQCINPGDTVLCYGEEITYCVDINPMPAHDSIRIEYDFFPNGTWDGNGNFGGGVDFWYCVVSGDTIFRTTFSTTGNFGNFQSYPDEYVDGSVPPFSQCSSNTTPMPMNNNPGQGTAYRLSHTIAHNSPLAIIDFISGLNESPANENWSMDSVVISIKDANIGWQIFYQQGFTTPLSLGPEWNAASATNCNYPLFPISINPIIVANQSAIGPFSYNTRIQLNTAISSNNSSQNASVLWSTGATTPCITVNPTVSTIYTVIAQDDSTFCSDSVQVDINPQINITTTVNNNSFPNACNGAIFPFASGGLAPLFYQWDTSGTFLPQTIGGVIDSLCENTYCLTVTDANACTADTCVNIEWNPCNLNLLTDSIDCNGGTTNIQAIVDTTAGLGPFPYLPAPRFVYSLYSLNPTTLIQSQPFGSSNFPFNNPLIVAGDYLVTVYDNSWQDSCYNTISISEPDPILIYTSIDSTSAPWIQDGVIAIDSITGGTLGYNITWLDSVLIPLPTFGNLVQDSLGYSNQYNGGYTINVTDINGCSLDTIVYLHPKNPGDSLFFESISVIQPTCFKACDAFLEASISGVGTLAVPPFTFKWYNLLTGALLKTDSCSYDSLSMSFVCSPFYNADHVGRFNNRCAGVYSLQVYDYYGNSFSDQEFVVIEPDSIYVVINPDLDSISLNCSQNILLSAVANPLPGIAQLMPDTQLVTDISGNNSFLFDFNSGLPNGATYSLYDSPQRTYFLECTGILTDTSNPPVNYDAAFMDWPGNPTPQNSIFAWNISNGGIVPSSSAYDGVNHTYTWAFPADGNSATQNGLNINYYDHEFIVNTTILSGNLSCQVFGVVDTVIYDYEWTTVANPGVILSDADTLLTDSSIIITTDYVVTVTNTNGCIASDTIRIKKNLNTLTLNSLVITPVRPCYGDLTGEIHIEVVDSSGVQPFTYVLYDIDTIFMQSTSDTFFTGLASGNYVIQVQDTIGCLNPFALVFIDQPDTIFACGVDELNDTTFDVFTHTVIANDPSTWIFQMGILAPNFLYYLEIDSNFTLHSTQSSSPYNQDAAFDGLISFNGNAIFNPTPGPYWTVNGDVLRPDINIINSTNTYIYNNPSDVNNSGAQTNYFTGFGNTLNFEFIDGDNDTTSNQGGLVFKLHKIACTQIDTAYTCKGEGLAFAYVRPQSVNGNLGGIPYAGTDGVLGTSDDYYETAWIQYNPNTGVNIDTIQGGPGAGASDTIVGLFAGSYRVVVIDSLGCSEFVRYLEVLEPIDTFITILDTVIHVLCKYDSTGEIHLSNFGGFDSIAWNGSSIVSIASTTSRYVVLLRDNAIYNACGDVNNIIPSADYTDTIISIYGVLDSIIFDNLTAHRYRVYIYDSIPDATYGQYDPFTGELLDAPFNYMQCPNIIDVFISEPCDSLRSFTSVLTNVKCWGDSTAQAEVSAFGGAEPWVYTYQWHNAPFGINGIGEVGPIADSLWADTTQFPSALWHTVTVTDPNGCTVEDSVEIKHANRKIQPFYIDLIGDTILELKFIEDSVSCFTLCDGMVSLETFGGVWPHTYVFEVNPNDPVLNSPGVADTLGGLCEGGHNIIITDLIGCTDTIIYRIDEPDELEVVASEDDPIQCFGYNNGTAFTIGYGGNNVSNQQSAYTFNWFIDGVLYNTIDSLIGVGDDIDSLPPGIHTVQITDYKGCVATDTVEMIEPTQLSVMIIDTSTVYAYCEFTNSAKLCAQAFGGTPGYTYVWDDVASQNNSSPLFENSQFCAENLQPINTNSLDGNYNVFVTDSRGCPADATINIDTITNTFNANSIRYTATDVSCFGGFDGSISIDALVMIDSIVISNGILDTISTVVYSPLNTYNITWTGPGGFSQTGANIGSLSNGEYAVYIEDTMGCQRNKNITINEPAKLKYGIYNWKHQTCIGDLSASNSFGSGDGQIMVNISGGTGTYYYDKSESNVWPIPAADTVAIINDTLIDLLYSGQHNIYITDDNGCDGEVILGGTGTKMINTLVNTSLAVTNIPYGFANVSTDSTTCSNSNDGEAKIPNVPGANPLLNYSWILDPYLAPTSAIGPQSFAVLNTIVDVGSSTSILAQDNYVLVAHYADAASFGVNYLGCDSKKEFEIFGPSAIQENSTVTAVSCWGDSTGSISLSPSGGAGGYSYAWDATLSIPNGSNLSAVNNLLAGTYTVTITDAAECDFTFAIIVDQPDQLQNNFTIIDVKCNGGANGQILEGGFGGTSPYNQIVEDITGNTVTNTALVIGDYSVTLTDGNGCSITDIVTVGQPDPFTLSLEPTYNYGVDADGSSYAISCKGLNDGVVLAVVAGGLAPYDYTWSNGSSINPAINLAAGDLTLELKDKNGCIITKKVELLEPDAIDDEDSISSYGNTLTLNQVSCLGASDGLISLDPSGGVPFSNGLYSYTWTGPNGFSSTSKDIYDLTAGIYKVAIEDANGCIDEINYPLISPPNSFNASVSTLNYAGAANPPFNVTFIDSTKDISGNSIVVNHTWSWNDLPVNPITEYQQFSYEFTEVGLNAVYVVVENASTGCKDTVNFVVQVQGIDFITNVFSPNGDGINDEFVFDETGIKVVSVEIYNRWGSLVMNWTGLDKTWDGTGPDGQKLPEAVYFYVLSGEGEDGYYYENKGTITLRR